MPAPRAIIITLNVVMKGATLKRATTVPPTAPTRPQARIPAAKPTATTQADAVKPPICFINTVAITAENAIRLPTDKSIPAVMITIVMPIAITAITTIRSTIASKLDRLRKSGHRRSRGRQ